MENGWKTIAIIFMVLFIIENLIFAWAILYTWQEEQYINECYYDVSGTTTCNG